MDNGGAGWSVDARDFLQTQLMSPKNSARNLEKDKDGKGGKPDINMKNRNSPRGGAGPVDLEGKSLNYRGRQFQDITQRYQNR